MNSDKNQAVIYKPFKLSETFNLKRDFYKISLFMEVLIIFTVFSILTKGMFLSSLNLSNLLMQGCTTSIIACSMMLVIVSTNADLSAGLAVGFLGMIAAKLQVEYGWSAILVIIVTLGVGVLLGMWHGFWIGYIGLPSFIVTYATQLLYKGGTILISNGKNVGAVKGAITTLGKGYMPDIKFLNMNVPSLLFAAVCILLYAVLAVIGRHKKIAEGVAVYPIGPFIGKIILIAIAISIMTVVLSLSQGFCYGFLLLCVIGIIMNYVVNDTCFGRYVFAIGGNAEAARMSGIDIRKTVCQIYVIHTLIIAFASIVYLGRITQATPIAGTGFEFTAITGCVVGGTSILGGSGNVLGAVIGTMLMAALDNGMSMMNLGTQYQYVIKGLILMFAISMDVISKKSK